MSFPQVVELLPQVKPMLHNIALGGEFSKFALFVEKNVILGADATLNLQSLDKSTFSHSSGAWQRKLEMNSIFNDLLPVVG